MTRELLVARTQHWKIYYKKSSRDPTLPTSTFTPIQPDPSLDPFPIAASSATLLGFVDAAHANDLCNRRSTTGYTFTLCGGAIMWKSKSQPICATSSTEAEFCDAVSAVKTARYLRSILGQLGFPQTSPTPIYEDNKSAIQMINASVPTDRSRHIAIQHFAIIDYKQAGDIVMVYISTHINPADALGKPLGWVLAPCSNRVKVV